MEKQCSSSIDQFRDNIRHLPHADLTITSSNSNSKSPTQVKVKRPKAEFIPLEKAIKPGPKQGIKLFEFYDKAPPTKLDSPETSILTDNFKIVEAASPDSNITSINNKKNETSGDGDSNIKGAPTKGSTKACLYEICAANYWKPPSFECCKEEGPSHQRMFTFKVIVEIEEASDMVLECFGAPQSKKKTAAEHAAEGALWYLNHLGYFLNHE